MMSEGSEYRLHVEGEVAQAELTSALEAVLSGTRLMTLATVDPVSRLPHANTCYFAERGVTALFILTPPATRHGKYIAATGICAANIFSTEHRVGDLITGLQLFGHINLLDVHAAEDAYNSYISKHVEFKQFAPNAQYIFENFESRFYRMDIRSGKLIDEERFGREKYIPFTVELVG